MTGRPKGVQPPPHDDNAERAFLGGIALFPDRLEEVDAGLTPADFYRPSHQVLFQAELELVAEGVTGPLDTVLLTDRCRRHDPDFSHEVVASVLTDAIAPMAQHSAIILRCSASRRLLAEVGNIERQVHDGADPFEIAATAARELDELGTAGNDQPEALTLPELLTRADQVAPWVVPGLMRLDWRAVLVAPEGAGKRTLLRQLAVAASQGVHPLRFDAIPPVRTLVIDAENPLAAIAETGAGLDRQARDAAGDRYDPERCRIWSRPGGLDLRQPAHRAELVREIRAQQPQLVVAGPLYKLGRRQPGESYEEAAEGLQQVFDDLRTRFGFALVLEHHAPKGEKGSREMAPFGSQRWLAWPELGLGLYAEHDGRLRVARFRGDRMASSWPDRLGRARAWPFEGFWQNGLRKVAV